MPAQLNKLIIVAIEYLEKDFQETRDCIAATGLPVYYVKRNPEGVGSLAEAINRGFRESGAIRYEYCWFVTNITFDPDVPLRLCRVLNLTLAAAIHPAFSSDHAHLTAADPQKLGFVQVPFIEFTAAMVRTCVFAVHKLDEKMPFWGHDLDFGYRLLKAGFKILVHKNAGVYHTYIRNKYKSNTTLIRLQNRRNTDASTVHALKMKYGQQWKKVNWPGSEKLIGDFYKQVVAQEF